MKYFVEEIEQNELKCYKHNITLNYIEHFLILAFAVIGCISTSAFASLFGIIRSKMCAITAGIKKHKSIIKKKKKKHEKNSIVSKI